MKTKLVVRPGIIAIKYDEKPFFSTTLGSNPNWVYKDSNDYKRQKITNLNTINKIHLKCDGNDGCVVNGLTQPKIYSLVLETPLGYKVFCEPEAVHYKKLNKSVLNTLTFYLEHDDYKKLLK